MHDLTTEEVFDYTRKRGVEHSKIVLPTAAAKGDINWAWGRESPWNAAELAEKRKDARVAREYEVAMPHELTRSQRVELVRAFSADLANRYGVAVDFAIHAPHREGDERNHHARILTTTRRVTATSLGEKASVEWSDTDRAKKELEPSLVNMQRLSLGRAALQHPMVALVAIAITLLAVWWYVPAKDEIASLRNEHDQLQAPVEDLKQHGGRIAVRDCGPQKRLCVQVGKEAGKFGPESKGSLYMVAKGH